ncbi:MAG TPA: mannosyltransferase [Actinobacteria bacterium]|nr:mannosyltransferase [Actinomycetota bacterium]
MRVSVVIPVYSGETTLPHLVAELAELRSAQVTPSGRAFEIAEVLLVWDRGPGRADDAIRLLADKYDFVRPIWLSRNFGQHAATLAGMTSSQGRWVVTMDEDGQMDPAYIGAMLDRAYTERAQLVYAAPSNPPPHGAARNAASRMAKWLFVKVLAGRDFESFNSYRLMHGEVARSVAAYTGQGVYLDVALSWVVATVATEPVVMRDEGRPASNYSLSRLLAHFGRLVVSSGTRPLMFVSFLGAAFVVLGALLTVWILGSLVFSSVPVTGWPSTMVAILVVGGATLLSLGIIAQYVGAATNMSLGKPLYVVVSDPDDTFGDDP